MNDDLIERRKSKSDLPTRSPARAKKATRQIEECSYENEDIRARFSSPCLNRLGDRHGKDALDSGCRCRSTVERSGLTMKYLRRIALIFPHAPLKQACVFYKRVTNVEEGRGSNLVVDIQHRIFNMGTKFQHSTVYSRPDEVLFCTLEKRKDKPLRLN